jgi:hypothetical protein
MRRLARPGTVLLVAGVVLLGAAAVHRLTAPASQRVLGDRAAFARYVAGRPGSFGPVHVMHVRGDRVCSTHRHPAYRLCGTVHRRPDGVRVFAPQPLPHRRGARR